MANQNNLKFELKTKLPQLAEGEAVAVCVFEGERQQLSGASDGVIQTIENVMQSGEFKGEEETSLVLHDAELGGAHTLILLGCCKQSDECLSSFSKAAATAVRMGRSSHIKHLYFILPTINDEEHAVRTLVEGATLGLYDNGFYQHQEESIPQLEKLTLIVSNESDTLLMEAERGRIIAEAVNWARALADEPGASLPPREFARRAAEMAEEFGLKVETLTSDEIRERGMGGLWGVGRGSDEPPALIVLRYEPEGAQS